MRLAILFIFGLLGCIQCSEAQTFRCALGNTDQVVRGYFFDVEAMGDMPVSILGLNTHASFLSPIEVLVAAPGQSYAGIESVPSAWTSLGSYTTGTGMGSPGPLGPLFPGFTVAPGERRGVYVTSFLQNSVITSFVASAPTLGYPFFVDNHVGLRAGPWANARHALIGGPAMPEMCIFYRVGSAEATVSFVGPVAPVTNVELANWSQDSVEGFMLVSTIIPPYPSFPWFPSPGNPGAGPVFGLWTDVMTFTGFTTPYWPGNPFHFRVADLGVFPQTPFVLSSAETMGLSGLSLDLAFVLQDAGGTIVDASNVERVVFP